LKKYPVEISNQVLEKLGKSSEAQLLREKNKSGELF